MKQSIWHVIALGMPSRNGSCVQKTACSAADKIAPGLGMEVVVRATVAKAAVTLLPSGVFPCSCSLVGGCALVCVCKA